MNIIILGSNQASIAIVHALNSEANDITLICDDSYVLESLAKQLDIRVIVGVPSYPHILYQANAGKADLIIALTQSDEMNMVACQIAYSLFKVPLKMACIKSSDYFLDRLLFNDSNLPIDVFINPSQMIAEAAYRIVSDKSQSDFQKIEHTDLMVSIVNYHESGVSYASIKQKYQINLAAIKRQGKIIEDLSGLYSLIDDELCIIALKDNLNNFVSSIPRFVKRSIIIAGGGPVSTCLAKLLSNRYKVKLIESDLTLCKNLARQLPDTTILNASVSDNKFLLQESVDDTDVFCSLTDDDEDNILNCMQAKHLGAKYAIACIQKAHYLPMLQDKSIDKVISMQDIISKFVLSHTRHNLCLDWPGAELVQVKGSKIDPKVFTLEEFNFCGVWRQSEYIVECQDILPEDIVIILVPDNSAWERLQGWLN